MGRRSRRRAKEGTGGPGAGAASFAELDLDLDLSGADPGETEAVHELPDGSRLTLRTTMTPGTRGEYAAVAKGERSAAAATREDAWQRAVEFLFERLALRWEVAGVQTAGERELLARLRAATRAERALVRDALRAHVAEHFPDLDAP
jgi:CRP-like cAMP-binding protein